MAEAFVRTDLSKFKRKEGKGRKQMKKKSVDQAEDKGKEFRPR